MSKLFHVFVYLTINSLWEIEAARILAVFPAPSLSHQVVFRPLTQELARRGHEVVVITPNPVFPKGQAPPNLTEIDVQDVSYGFWNDKVVTLKMGCKEDLIGQMEVLFEGLPKLFKVQLQNEEFKDLVENKRDYFDLLLIEACARPALALHHVFNVPIIQVSSFGRYLGSDDIVGAPMHPLLYPLITSQRIYNLTMWEKVVELYNYYSIHKLYQDYEEMEIEILRSVLGSDVPMISEIKKNVDMLFLNTHPIWEGNQPVPPNVVYLWGLYQKPKKELPEDLQNYLDSSKNGVIYMSFGSNVLPSLLSPEKISIFVKVFSQLPYDILWKWDKDELPGRSKNIKIGKWFPQSDLLRHPKIKLFITQGGLQSTDEAMRTGVPVVGIPLVGDQWYNVEKYVHHKFGVQVDYETLTEDTFRNAIDTVIGDESYRQNMVKIGNLTHDQPESPLDRAVWWTEYVLKHGGAKHLRSPAANITWRQYLELDLVFTLLIALLIVVALSVTIVYYLCRVFIGKKKLKSS